MADDASNTPDKGEQLLAKRIESPLVARLSLGLGAILGVIAISWAIDFWLNLGFTWYDEQAMVACLGLTLGIIFIR